MDKPKLSLYDRGENLAIGGVIVILMSLVGGGKLFDAGLDFFGYIVYFGGPAFGISCIWTALGMPE